MGPYALVRASISVGRFYRMGTYAPRKANIPFLYNPPPSSRKWNPSVFSLELLLHGGAVTHFPPKVTHLFIAPARLRRPRNFLVEFRGRRGRSGVAGGGGASYPPPPPGFRKFHTHIGRVSTILTGLLFLCARARQIARFVKKSRPRRRLRRQLLINSIWGSGVRQFTMARPLYDMRAVYIRARAVPPALRRCG